MRTRMSDKLEEARSSQIDDLLAEKHRLEALFTGHHQAHPKLSLIYTKLAQYYASVNRSHEAAMYKSNANTLNSMVHQQKSEENAEIKEKKTIKGTRQGGKRGRSAARKLTHNGDPLILLAAGRGDMEEVRRLMQEGDDVNEQSSAGWTALSEAVTKEHAEMVDFLLSKGADPNSASIIGWSGSSLGGGLTPLHEACSSGSVTIACKLIGSGADVTKGNVNGWIAVDFLEQFLKENVEILDEKKMKECEKLVEDLMEMQHNMGFVRVSDPIIPNGNVEESGPWWDEVRRMNEEGGRGRRRTRKRGTDYSPTAKKATKSSMKEKSVKKTKKKRKGEEEKETREDENNETTPIAIPKKRNKIPEVTTEPLDVVGHVDAGVVYGGAMDGGEEQNQREEGFDFGLDVVEVEVRTQEEEAEDNEGGEMEDADTTGAVIDPSGGNGQSGQEDQENTIPIDGSESVMEEGDFDEKAHIDDLFDWDAAVKREVITPDEEEYGEDESRRTISSILRDDEEREHQFAAGRAMKNDEGDDDVRLVAPIRVRSHLEQFGETIGGVQYDFGARTMVLVTIRDGDNERRVVIETANSGRVCDLSSHLDLVRHIKNRRCEWTFNGNEINRSTIGGVAQLSLVKPLELVCRLKGA
ncbi:hypothetical protein PFISCL1PPCAC_11408 [Pristionchus fissidentatus]|uniref:Ankyrin repeat-containing protein n=1 Tax=Pristionchus fissidentatus TaxID=1538716 RepID=A0AAV5VL19_9BILA|nr:hypothetical protein PFISCL1PPCAC_11408 [Pristionchus fissidentatus]